MHSRWWCWSTVKTRDRSAASLTLKGALSSRESCEAELLKNGVVRRTRAWISIRSRIIGLNFSCHIDLLSPFSWWCSQQHHLHHTLSLRPSPDLSCRSVFFLKTKLFLCMLGLSNTCKHHFRSLKMERSKLFRCRLTANISLSPDACDYMLREFLLRVYFCNCNFKNISVVSHTYRWYRWIYAWATRGDGWQGGDGSIWAPSSAKRSINPSNRETEEILKNITEINLGDWSFF